MHLPDEVGYDPSRLGPWISGRQAALITLKPGLGYTVNDRKFAEIEELFSEDYQAFTERYHLEIRNPDRVYSGAEHKGDPQQGKSKLPNITVVPNLPTQRTQAVQLHFDHEPFRLPTGQEVTLFGSTMGHWHSETGCPEDIQEIYEFQSYGALLIDRPQSDQVELWIARDGDKVAIPQQCHMTLYNLDDLSHPLITLDFANPNRNRANKELVKGIGPILLAYYTAHEAVFVLNHRYINRRQITYEDPSPPSSSVDNRQCLNGGVRLPVSTIGQGGREVRVPLGTRVGLGQQLYEALTGNPEVITEFSQLGIRVHQASPEIQLDGISYGRPLAEAVKLGKFNSLYRFFSLTPGKGDEVSNEAEEHVPDPERPLHVEEERWCRLGPYLLEPGRREGEPAQRDIPILIEGAGDWVEKALIPSIEQAREELARRLSQGHSDFSVIIADDSRWHSPGKQPPVKPDCQVYPELRRVIDHGLNHNKSYNIAPQGVTVPPKPVVFLDKADPSDLQIYQQLQRVAGVVFVVTPDYTHSVLCQRYLDRATTVFVEKPFDANWENVRALLEARGRAALNTEIYALDHYRFYAWQLKGQAASGRRTLLEEATDWLDGALSEARFCMTEKGSVEPHRIRALQYGLLLDMLPHCFATLAFFGDLDTTDEFSVLEVGRYEGAPIPNETYARVRFTFEDYSENGWRVPCEAWVGKGLDPGRKYFEVVGRSGQSILIALGDTTWRHRQADHQIAGGIYFVDKDGNFVDDQGQKSGRPRVALSFRYKQLFVDLVTGQHEAIVCAMPLVAGERIVYALDRFWNTIQSHTPWVSYEFGNLDCFKS